MYRKTCKAMQGLIEEGQDVIDEDAEPEVKDAAAIAAAQRVEHYEIAAYGCVSTYAQLLKNKQAARLLNQTLKEEGATDKTLTRLAESINVQAEKAQGKRAEKNGKAGNGRSPKSITKRMLKTVGL
jgi:ferritin-like metal-binding protein YciE